MSNLSIIKPVISEKSFTLAGTGVYVFHVRPNANKKVVATEVHEMFKVDVVSVNIINIPGKIKRSGKKFGKRSDIKKALVRVKAGQKISIFESETEDKKDTEKKVESSKIKDQNDSPKIKKDKNLKE